MNMITGRQQKERQVVRQSEVGRRGYGKNKMMIKKEGILKGPVRQKFGRRNGNKDEEKRGHPWRATFV